MQKNNDNLKIIAKKGKDNEYILYIIVPFCRCINEHCSITIIDAANPLRILSSI